MKSIRVFLSEDFHFLMVIFSVFLNRHVFVMDHSLVNSPDKRFLVRNDNMRQHFAINSATKLLDITIEEGLPQKNRKGTAGGRGWELNPGSSNSQLKPLILYSSTCI